MVGKRRISQCHNHKKMKGQKIHRTVTITVVHMRFETLYKLKDSLGRKGSCFPTLLPAQEPEQIINLRPLILLTDLISIKQRCPHTGPKVNELPLAVGKIYHRMSVTLKNFLNA